MKVALTLTRGFGPYFFAHRRYMTAVGLTLVLRESF